MEQKNRYTDLLTGLLNRAAFEENLRGAIEKAKETDTPVSLAYFDVDNFKQLNDEHGHAGGDVILKVIAGIVKRMVEDQVLTVRFGGDEFALIFPGTEREQAFLQVERIRAEIEKQNAYQDENISLNLHLTISGGVAAYPIDGSDENELLRKADGALYRAKVTGRNKVSLAYEERMVPKTAHYTQTQLERLSELAKEQGLSEAVLLREALDDLLTKYKHNFLFLDRR